MKEIKEIKIIEKNFVEWMNEKVMDNVEYIIDNKNGIKYVNTAFKGGETIEINTAFKVEEQ
jgi:hypothetical protein